VITCHDGPKEVRSDDEVLVLPHPFAHERAFVLVPWLAVDPGAALTVGNHRRAVADLLDALDPAERDGVRRTDLVLVT
jgi:2-amino-4-hydroxy-6-hydroxymethyldihydropteridine diphosphokinase